MKPTTLLNASLLCMTFLAGSVPAAAEIRPDPRVPSGQIPRACAPFVNTDGIVDCWLAAYPKIANSIVFWFDAKDTPKAWPDWDEPSKQAVRDAYKYILKWYTTGMGRYYGPLIQDPPVNLSEAAMVAGQPAHLVISKEDAWTVYSSHIGLNLVLEINGFVPWSLRNYSSVSLDHLLNAYTSKTSEGFNNAARFWPAEAVPDPVSPAGYIVWGHAPSNPITVFKFLKDNDLIADTPKETIGKALRWSSRLRHMFCGWADPQIVYAYWQYYSGPTLFGMMHGTVYTGPGQCGFNGIGPQHYTGGCGSTVEFLRAVLRAVNIPVMDQTMLTEPGSGHGGAWFSGENLFLSHGDAPYDRIAAGYYPPDLLITAQTFSAWFPKGDFAAAKQNIDRRTVELAVTHPGPGLVDYYCKDTQSGKDHASGDVYKRFAPFFTVQHLENAGLWDKLADLALATPGCLPQQ